MKNQVVARLPLLVLAGVLTSATGCVDLGLFSSIQAGYADDCTRVAVVWTEQSAGGTLVPTEISCAAISTQSAQNPELVKACEFELAPPARCTGSDAADGTVDSEVGQPDCEVGHTDSEVGQPDGEVGPETAEVSPDGETDGGGPEAEVGPETDVPVVCDMDCDLQDTVCQDFSCVGGTCVAENLTAECDDGEACTHTDVCVAGVCEGTAYDCTPEAECQESTCDGAGGCSAPVAKPGWCVLATTVGPVACFETGEQVEYGGFASCFVCLGDGTVTGGLGFATDGTNCNENCIQNATCQAGACVGTEAPDGTSCSGLNPCMSDGTCSAGDCGGVEPKDCSDGNICTADVCDADGLCANPTTTSSGIKIGGFDAEEIFVFGRTDGVSLGTIMVTKNGGSSAATAVVPIVAPTIVGSVGSPSTLQPVGAKDVALVNLAGNTGTAVIRQLNGGAGNSIDVLRSAGSESAVAIVGNAPAATDFGANGSPLIVAGPESFVAAFNPTLDALFVVRHANPAPSWLFVDGTGAYGLGITSNADVSWPSPDGTLTLSGGSGTNSYWLSLNATGQATAGFLAASGFDPTLSIESGHTNPATAVTFLAATYANPIEVGPIGGSVTAPSVTGRDGYIAKHWAGGALAWVSWLTGSGDISIKHVVRNGSGVTVMGTSEQVGGGIVNIGTSETLSSTASLWTFIAAFDGDGAVLWTAKMDNLFGGHLSDEHLLSGSREAFTENVLTVNGIDHVVTTGEGNTFSAGLNPLTGAPTTAWGFYTPAGQLGWASSGFNGLWTSGTGAALSGVKMGASSTPLELPASVTGTWRWGMYLSHTPCF